MIDYLRKFTDEASAKADPVVGAYFVNGAWRGDRVIPDTKVWNINNDVAGTSPDGDPTVTHTYDAGWFITISEDVDVPALRADASCVLAVDWSGPSVLAANPPAGTQAKDYRVSPVFAGREVNALLASL